MSPEEASRECPIYANDKNSEVSKLLAKASILSAQPNKVWSLVHFLTFNLIDLQITQEKGLASQALATLLAQNFWCNDCRSFFEVGVIEPFGMPPLATGMDIAKWWHHAHNTASEHVATTRAGHPWIHQLDALRTYQNPFYMTWEDAYHMWHVKIWWWGSCTNFWPGKRWWPTIGYLFWLFWDAGRFISWMHSEPIRIPFTWLGKMLITCGMSRFGDGALVQTFGQVRGDGQL